MKPLEDQDHYEVLEVPHGARQEEIERAYPIVRAAYEEASLATYSVFAASESDVIRQRIDLAYQVLTDQEARRSYDRRLGFDALPFDRPGDAAAAASVEVRPAIDTVDSIDAIDEFDELDEEEGEEYDGARLRRARLRRGIELDQISEITRINPSYLRCIEEDAFGELPAAVYTRGFVTAYARAIGLEPQSVAAHYMERFKQTRGGQRSGGLLFGRRERD